jgi:ABC-2 type transport system ATP-binding protein
MVESCIMVEKLVKKYEDVTAVDGLSLRVEEGELFGLLGPNGAGKTTTISILCGLLKPTGGSATVCGYDVQKEAVKIRRLIGVCIQETAVYPYLLTGEENVKFFGDLYAMNKGTLESRCAMLFEKNGACQQRE